MDARVAVLVAVALAGCLGGSNDSPEKPNLAPASAACVPESVAREALITIEPGMHYIRTPTGGASWDGRHARLAWTSDVARLTALNLTATWNAVPGGSDVRLGLLNENATSLATHWAHGPVNGRAPLYLAIPQPNVAAIGKEITIDVGTSQDPPFPLFASAAVLPQEVHVVVRETYGCPTPLP